jgi:hypothetical protein
MPCHEDAEGLDRTPAERPRYVEGQLLSADDLRDEQEYWLRKLRLHNTALHGAGVVCGLAVASQDRRSLTVAPGVAIDGLGREIVVSEPVEIEIATDVSEADVVLRYTEEPTRWSVNGEATRIREGFEVLIEGRETSEPSGVVLARLERSERKGLTVVTSDASRRA